MSTEESTTPPGHDASLETLISVVLRAGVVLSGALVALGGLLVVGREWLAHSPPATEYPHSIAAVISGVAHGDGVAILTLGLLVLLATPIVRVALSLVGYVRERDWRYVVITAIVLSIITLSLLLGKAGA
ncbi:MAG TPA: DUF1634 domain-containing protein [Ktedonobacterales bacterium]